MISQELLARQPGRRRGRMEPASVRAGLVQPRGTESIVDKRPPTPVITTAQPGREVRSSERRSRGGSSGFG
jgi:hypothetical protein